MMIQFGDQCISLGLKELAVIVPFAKEANLNGKYTKNW